MSRTESHFGSPAPVSVTLAGVRFTIPARNAAYWIDAVISDQTEISILPGMLEEEHSDYLLDMIQNDRVREKDLLNAAYRALTTAAGRDWWVAIRLTGAVTGETGQVMGELILRGVNPSALTYAHWLDAVYALMVRNMDEKALFKFNASLMLAPSIEGIEIEEATMDESQVLAMLRTMPGASIGG